MRSLLNYDSIWGQRGFWHEIGDEFYRIYNSLLDYYPPELFNEAALRQDLEESLSQTQ